MTILLAEIGIKSPVTGATATVRLADAIIAPFPPDDPDRPNACWDPSLTEPPNLALELYGDVAGGGMGSSYGEVTAENTDGRYTLYRGWSVVTITLRVGDATGRVWADFLPLIQGGGGGKVTAAVSPMGVRVVTFPLSDPRDRLADAVVEDSYGGTTVGEDGYDGTEDQEGTIKSLALGDLSAGNVPATPVNTTLQTFQPGLVFGSITAIRDRGAVTNHVFAGDLTGAAFDAARPGPTEFFTDAARGLVRPGGSFGGTVTFDLMGDPPAGTTAPTMIKWLLERRGFTSFGPGFDDVALAPAVVGLWTGTATTSYRDLVDLLCRGFAGWCLPDALGVWQLARLAAPVGDVVAAFYESDIIDLHDGQWGYDVPPWKWGVKWGRQCQTYTRDQLAGQIADEGEILRLKDEWQTVWRSDPLIKAAYDDAATVEVETALRSKADAEALADTLAALFGRTGETYELVTAASVAAMAVPLGAEVHLSYPRESVVGDFRVVGKTPAGPQTGQVALTLWRPLP